MKSVLNYLPLALSGLRLLLVPLLWGFALTGKQQVLAVGLVVALLTDVLDGQAARWLGHSSETESQFDSLADKVVTLSVLAWVLLLHPEVVRDHPLLALVVLLLGLVSWSVGLLRHGRVTGLHLRLAKLAGVMQGLFVLHTFWSGIYHPTLLYLAAGSWCLAATEEIVVQFTHPHVDGSTRSAFSFWARR